MAEDEAYARLQAAIDARNEGTDIWILARTDSLIHGYDEALRRARRFKEMGADAVFVEALPDREAMARFARDLDFPVLANLIPGGRTEMIPARDVAAMGYSCASYPFVVLAGALKGVREALEALKESMALGGPVDTLPALVIMDAVGFTKYYKEEERYQYGDKPNGLNGHQ